MPISPETQLEIERAIQSGGHLPPGYMAFVIKWMAFNRAYNEVEKVQGDWKKVQAYAVRHQDRWNELIELANNLVSIECIGSEVVGDSDLVAPSQSVKAATIFLRQGLGLAVDVNPNECTFAGCTREEKRRICNRVPIQAWEKGELAALLRLVYQVRCNLLHGEKRLMQDDFFQTNRDRQLVRICTRIVDHVLNWFLP